VLALDRDGGWWGGFTSESVRCQPLMLAHTIELLPENDIIVFQRGMYATLEKKVRYYAEKTSGAAGT